MPLRKLFKERHSLGYNSRDFPTEIEPNSCQSLYNAFPGASVLRPRNGIIKWNSNAEGWGITVDEIIPWSEDDDEVILISGKSFYYVSSSDVSPTLLSTTTVADGTKFSWIRIQNSLYIITDREDNDASFIISKNSDGFFFRNGNIESLPVTVAVTAFAGSAVSAGKVGAILVTLVRRDDEQSMDADGKPVNCDLLSSTNGFNPGKLESVGDLDTIDYITGSGGASKSFYYDYDLPAGIDPQVTHIRFYRTLEADSQSTAAGLAFRWRADVAIESGKTTYRFTDIATDSQMAGSLNQWKTSGYDRIPAGSVIYHYKGHIWIGGKVNDDNFMEHRGRWYFSETIQDADFPDKWYSYFNTAINFKDTSLEDQEDGSMIGVFYDDLIFIMSKSTVWKLVSGDPTLEPQLISSTKGSKFTNTITQIDKMLVYLSNEGPAYIEDGDVKTMREFTAGEVWPELWDGSKGFFFKLTDPTAVRTFYFKSTWWICYNDMIVGMYMPTVQKGFGPLRVVPSWSQIRAESIAVLGFNKCVILSNHSGQTFLWDFLNPSAKADNGYIYTIESTSKAFYVNLRNPELAGELFDMLLHARFTDVGKLILTIIADRFLNIFSRDYSQSSSGALLAQDIDNPKRNVFQQGFTEGLMGRVFEINWKKDFRYPFDFEMRGYTLNYKPLPENPFEYQSDIVYDDITAYDALDEDRSIVPWEDEGKIKDAGDESRDIDDYDIADPLDAEERLALLEE